MDAPGKTRPAIRSIVPVLAAAVLLVPLGTGSLSGSATSLPGPEGIWIYGGTLEGERLVNWAVSRYRAAGLRLPSIDVYWHRDPTGCRGGQGYYDNGRVDLCAGVLINLESQYIVLHELAHAWCDAHLTQRQRVAFDADRGIPTWNSSNYAWTDRGFEQSAEILAWGLGDGILTPAIPGDSRIATYVAEFEFLAGVPPLHDAPSSE